MAIPFIRELSFEYGAVAEVAPQVGRVIANNPSAFTFHGTGTFIVGDRSVAVIDPGPDDPAHVAALLSALDGREVTHILITHTHVDHSPAAKALQAATGAPTYGYGPHAEGRFERGQTVEAGADTRFVPDHRVQHGEVLEGNGWTIECVHTPGHCSNHICYQLRQERILFTGDHVMGWSTSVVSPPDGDMGEYMASLRLLLDRDDRLYLPTHGAGIGAPKPFVEAFIAHRLAREQQILASLEAGRDRIDAMVAVMYADVPAMLHPAAARSVLSHMLHMLERDVIACEGEPGLQARYRLGE